MFVNTSGIIGQAIVAATQNITGDLFTTLLMGFIILMVLLLAAGVPLEWMAIIMVPLFITGLAYTSALLPITGICLIYLGILLAKYYFSNR